MSGLSTIRRAAGGLLLLIVLLVSAFPVAAEQPGSADLPAPCNGYIYLVRRGDTWNSVAQRTGINLPALQASNPQALHPNGWLYMGEVLCIPDTSSAAPAQGYWYHVRSGDTWNTVARKTGVAVTELWRANARLLDHNLWLYVGQRVWIPAAAADATATPTPTAAAPLPTTAITATVVVTPTLAVRPSLTHAPTATSAPTAAAAAARVSPTPTATRRPPVTRLPASACPADADAFAVTILERLNGSTITPEGLAGWLAACGAVAEDVGGVYPVTLNDAADALVVVINLPADDPRTASGTLLVYHKGHNGIMQVYRADSAAWAELIEAADINVDGRTDLVWVERSCGAHTCYGTLHVDAWDADATTFADWLTGEPEMAEPEIRVEETADEGQGREIVLYGGVIGSAGAGPQRNRTETYISPDGAAYELFSQEYDASACIYDAVLDANARFALWAQEGFEAAIEAYRRVLDDETLVACGEGRIEDEVATLQDFARFRLVVSYVAIGRAATAQPLAGQIEHRALQGAADAFLKSYRATTSVIQACRDTTKYAQATPAAWEFLADWGYGNPTFTAADLCVIR